MSIIYSLLHLQCHFLILKNFNSFVGLFCPIFNSFLSLFCNIRSYSMSIIYSLLHLQCHFFILKNFNSFQVSFVQFSIVF